MFSARWKVTGVEAVVVLVYLSLTHTSFHHTDTSKAWSHCLKETLWPLNTREHKILRALSICTNLVWGVWVPPAKTLKEIAYQKKMKFLSLFIHIIPITSDLLSSVKHKRRCLEECASCSFPLIYCECWLTTLKVYSTKNKNNDFIQQFVSSSSP